MNWSRSDIHFMKMALRLAKKGAGYTSPNPMVGAVIVKDGTTLGKGYHRRFGGLHAEVEAIRACAHDARHATMYVNLEPCGHFGKTPPCVDQIVKAGIAEVVLSMIDPNPLVAGRGADMLRKRGVHVRVGLLDDQASRLNEAYLKYIVRREPFVLLKAAISLDGMIADSRGNSRWISCEESRRIVHRLRREVDAVLVGIGTVLRDDPELTVRLIRTRRNPKRIILDTSLRVPRDAKVLDEKAHTIIVTAALDEETEELKQMGKEVWHVGTDGREIDLRDFLHKAASEGITSILVEGGGDIYSSFLRQKLVDKLCLFIAPKLLGEGMPLCGKLSIGSLEHPSEWKDVSLKKVGSDIFVVAYPA
ncbi:hypothetical protein AMJ40_06290 [candidate division TA06 bacterium DG_26]|uniref:Riboflavin biosynthesis protein RibD n=1 Tax=candidate division TA06 bacterium DG_26 TaxID=1703771 RepID=A0A0S7WG33_UNCT6|nr:MAG: hypothetical protein AMJ40_06290 [candidate division TA06 bacterium DG_26]